MNLFLMDFSKKVIKFIGEYEFEEEFKILNV